MQFGIVASFSRMVVDITRRHLLNVINGSKHVSLVGRIALRREQRDMTSKIKNIEIRNVTETSINRQCQTPITDSHFCAQHANSWGDVFTSVHNEGICEYIHAERRWNYFNSCPKPSEEYGLEFRRTRNQEPGRRAPVIRTRIIATNL
jgi:hypothetical protein